MKSWVLCPSMVNIKPGFVQNCPAFKVIELAKFDAMVADLRSRAFAVIITGLILPISAKTGIGSSR